jgi:hypothetical protein
MSPEEFSDARDPFFEDFVKRNSREQWKKVEAYPSETPDQDEDAENMFKGFIRTQKYKRAVSYLLNYYGREDYYFGQFANEFDKDDDHRKFKIILAEATDNVYAKGKVSIFEFFQVPNLKEFVINVTSLRDFVTNPNTTSTFGMFSRNLFHESIHYAQDFTKIGVIGTNHTAYLQEAEAYYRLFTNTKLPNYNRDQQCGYALKAIGNIRRAMINGNPSSSDLEHLTNWLNYFNKL